MQEAYPEGMEDVWRQLKGNKAQWNVGAKIRANP